MTVLRALRPVFHDPRHHLYRVVDAVVWVLILLSIALTAVEISVDLSRVQRAWLLAVDRIILVMFAVELVLRVATFRPPELDLFRDSRPERARIAFAGRMRFLMRPLQLADLLAILALHPALRGLRALRLLRLLRGVRLFRYRNPFLQVAAAFQDNALLYVFATSFLATETVIGGLTMYLIERDGNPDIQTVWDGMWWTLVTLTTVGYGDITPVHAMGRAWGAILMVAGMFTLALFAGVVGHTLLSGILTLREEQFRMSRFSHHVVVVGYDAGARFLLEALVEELEGSDREVVLFGAGERPTTLKPEFRWITGEPTKESELDKVHLAYADTLIVIGPRAMPPAQADAQTLLTLFTARRYLRGHHATRPRRKPVHVVAEVLDSENVEHARAAGADEVIEGNRIGFSLLAHAVAQPGTADVMTRVVSAGAHSVYIGDGAPYVGKTFVDAAQQLKSELGVLLIGLRSSTSGADRINPADNLQVAPTDQLIYLATEARLPERHAMEGHDG